MIEIHSHLLPNIDDGVKSMEESLAILKKLEYLGYEKVIITPHYIDGTSYNVKNIDKYNLFTKLKEEAKKNNINLDLFLGNEIFLDENILNNLKNGECCTINSSKYVLIEIPRNDNINNLNELIFQLKNKGLVPILAHPERYMIVKENPNVLDDFIERGLLLQINFESISGKYGNSSKKLVKYILKNNLASFIGGDIHHENSIFFNNFKKNKKKIIKIIGEQKFKELIYTNPLKVINKEDIEN